MFARGDTGGSGPAKPDARAPSITPDARALSRDYERETFSPQRPEADVRYIFRCAIPPYLLYPTLLCTSVFANTQKY